uniref:At3g23295 n=1 Tax=Arabidopsis thaliana TaxID=3702 RepID=A0JQ19_ARATH|nr:At3g23295 [Arabidopsis thaliana]
MLKLKRHFDLCISRFTHTYVRSSDTQTHQHHVPVHSDKRGVVWTHSLAVLELLLKRTVVHQRRTLLVHEPFDST